MGGGYHHDISIMYETGSASFLPVVRSVSYHHDHHHHHCLSSSSPDVPCGVHWFRVTVCLGLGAPPRPPVVCPREGLGLLGLLRRGVVRVCIIVIIIMIIIILFLFGSRLAGTTPVRNGILVTVALEYPHVKVVVGQCC